MLGGLDGLDAMAPGRVADRSGITHGAISKLADRLSEKGLLIRREQHPDGGTHSIMLTAEVETPVPRSAVTADQNDPEFFGTLSKEGRQASERILRGLVEQGGL